MRGALAASPPLSARLGADLLREDFGARGTEARRRKQESTAILPATAAGIFDFEAFVEALPFLSANEKNKLKLAGGEIFDNLIRHAAPLEGEVAIIRAARRGARLYLAFYFKSHAFAPYAASSSCGKTEPASLLGFDSTAELEYEDAPFFDPLIGRWRGIGIHMCKNLTLSLSLRAGSRLDRIYLVF